MISLEKCLEGAGNLLTEDVSVIDVSGCEAVVSSVTLVTNAREEQLIGAAFINSDKKVATVKATLSAVNRRFDALLSN